MLFYNGKTHKLSNVYWHIPLNEKGKEEYLKPWSFTSDDGRFEMEFQPILDRAACINALVLKSDQHQVFGTYEGTVQCEGRPFKIAGLRGAAEVVRNRY